VWVGFCFDFSFAPSSTICHWPKNCSKASLKPCPSSSPIPYITSFENIKAVCIRLRVVKIEVWPSLQSVIELRELPVIICHS
jgi:hypothetical protein